MTYNTAADVTATIKTLNLRAKKAPREVKLTAHYQIAKRRISDAKLFAEKNTEHAVKCCWEARHHLNMCNFD